MRADQPLAQCDDIETEHSLARDAHTPIICELAGPVACRRGLIALSRSGPLGIPLCRARVPRCSLVASSLSLSAPRHPRASCLAAGGVAAHRTAAAMSHPQRAGMSKRASGREARIKEIGGSRARPLIRPLSAHERVRLPRPLFAIIHVFVAIDTLGWCARHDGPYPCRSYTPDVALSASRMPVFVAVRKRLFGLIRSVVVALVAVALVPIDGGPTSAATRFGAGTEAAARRAIAVARGEPLGASSRRGRERAELDRLVHRLPERRRASRRDGHDSRRAAQPRRPRFGRQPASKPVKLSYHLYDATGSRRRVGRAAFDPAW